jgi:hypothetical protein
MYEICNYWGLIYSSFFSSLSVVLSCFLHKVAFRLNPHSTRCAKYEVWRQTGDEKTRNSELNGSLYSPVLTLFETGLFTSVLQNLCVYLLRKFMFSCRKKQRNYHRPWAGLTWIKTSLQQPRLSHAHSPAQLSNTHCNSFTHLAAETDSQNSLRIYHIN